MPAMRDWPSCRWRNADDIKLGGHIKPDQQQICNDPSLRNQRPYDDSPCVGPFASGVLTGAESRCGGI